VGWLRRKGWCTIEHRDEEKVLVPTDEGKQALQRSPPETKVLTALKKGTIVKDQETLALLVKRGVVEEKERVVRTIALTEKGHTVVQDGLEITDDIVQLTPDLIRSGVWKTMGFRQYDVKAFAPALFPGKRHPVMQLVERIRTIFMEMGFSEISGDFVESCFWDMDVLFIPQDHPARDMQDTFYCSVPATMDIDRELVDIVAQVHETGGATGSQGWNYVFSRSEAERTLLRTHTTVNTIRYLVQHPQPPAKIFSIGKVFRKENIDSTHLPEFYQVEGIVYEKDADFCELIGVLKEFYHKLGFEHLRFRPSYYPYTEPSMDVEAQWRGQWMELGGSGMFRPEVTEPLGITHPVLAWGLGLERMALNLLDLEDIRDLYLSDIEWLRQQPLLR
jgi:phenylalanyl-tRNA synthetase alpha chain